MIDRAARSADLDVPTWIVLGPFHVARPDGLHSLIRLARVGDPAALAAVLEDVRRLAPAAWPQVIAGVAVPVPGHVPGPHGRLVATAARQIAAVRGWRHHHDALRRRRAAPEAKAGGPRDPGSDAATLQWRPPKRGHAIVLVDDVVRTGGTLRSCVEAIRGAGDERPVVAIVLASAIDLASGGGDRPPLQPDR